MVFTKLQLWPPMKNHYYKRSELVLFVYDAMLNGGIKMKEVVDKTGVSSSTAYLLIEDIQLYIADFYRYDLEIIKNKDIYYIKIKK